MNDDQTETTLPHAIWSGEFKIFGTVLRCHVLSNGKRIIDARDVAELFEVMGGDLAEQDEPGIEEFARWMSGR